MIARDARDVPLRHASPQRITVGPVGGTQRRPDLREWSPRRHLALGEQHVLRARLRPHALPERLGPLDALEAELGRQMDDVDRRAGQRPHVDDAVDRFLFGPRRARRRKVGRRDLARGERLVLQVGDHVAILTVELGEPAVRPDDFERLADEVVAAHAVAALLVGHEHLERGHAHADRFGNALEDRELVLQDEVIAEVQHARLLVGVLLPLDGLRQRLVPLGEREDEDGREPGQGRDLGAATPVVVFGAEMDVADDGPGEHDLAARVDRRRGVRQHVNRPERDDPSVLDRHRALEHFGGGDDLVADDQRVDAARRAHWSSPPARLVGPSPLGSLGRLIRYA